MCSIILRTGADGVLIGANRDEMVARSWEGPAEYWPGIIGGRDLLGGGTWMALNRHGVMAAILNRHGSLGPAPGKRSRGELPLLALRETSAEAAAARLSRLDASTYRSFNLVLADSGGAFLLRGLERGAPEPVTLAPGTIMLTSGEPNDLSLPRIARHLPKFTSADFAQWGDLLADDSPPWESSLDIPARNGFGTVCSSLLRLGGSAGPQWWFAAGAPHAALFTPVPLWDTK
ncbi:MAG TPA: NRDE family protein [Acidocella sp.]|jgi:uncharacterized protein with NRDE domain|uniref:NRDE family protein n=1 Tax=Acidocella sp. TaxID=50710 RepID=UPI002C7190C7|nr:NRDE family protein [Acidocella sp.]HVE22804.1 NRDE family protein [Acidocella sp.]